TNAEAANQSMTRFLAAVSHDLMQPLNAARMYSAALAHQDALPAEVRDLVHLLVSSLCSGVDMITDLLDISRLESGRV
ncbi:sensor histidine kinase, partial [Pseudomonas aeruginosa]|uniref:sensor histidine kinase n=1 Tax=Pseudomonas aeruginosa TaxID=287 RepID=UPI003CC67E5B